MMRSVAWVLFVLACVLPGWHFRDIVAAEAQLRLSVPLTRGEWKWVPVRGTEYGSAACLMFAEWIPSWRALGPRGQGHLCKTFVAFECSSRGDRAWELLQAYDNSAVAHWVLASLATSDRWQVRGAWNWISHRRLTGDPSSCVSMMGDEDFLRILLTPRRPDLTAWLAREIWIEEHNRGERVVTRWLRETRDCQAVFQVLYEQPLPGRVDTSDPAGRLAEARVRMLLSTGLENPDLEVREICNRLLEWMRLGLGHYGRAR